ncbi:hypothetical protein HW45_06990 [Vibrio sp. ER1A]|nr:hypothetical protein HW45_06990 [Vibrio sp. ER1A]
MPEQVRQACLSTMRGFHNTAELEQLLGKRPGVLANEINPKQRSHKLGLADVIDLMHITEDVQILRAIAAEFNHSIYFLADYAVITDDELLKCYSNWHAELGDVNRAFGEAIADNRIEPEELIRIEKELVESFQAALTFLNRVRSLVAN